MHETNVDIHEALGAAARDFNLGLDFGTSIPLLYPDEPERKEFLEQYLEEPLKGDKASFMSFYYRGMRTLILPEKHDIPSYTPGDDPRVDAIRDLYEEGRYRDSVPEEATQDYLRSYKTTVIYLLQMNHGIEVTDEVSILDAFNVVRTERGIAPAGGEGAQPETIPEWLRNILDQGRDADGRDDNGPSGPARFN